MARKSGVTVTKDIRKDVMRAFKAMAQDTVLIGVPSEKAFREPTQDEPKPPINNAEIGYISEFGAPEANIPARPHLVPGIKQALPKIVTVYAEVLPKVAATGNVSALRAAETKIGFIATSSVKSMIEDVIGPPLAESTLEARRRRGRSGETPLLDTGSYRNSIDFVIAPAVNVKNLGK